MEPLIAHIRRFVPLSEEEAGVLASVLTYADFSKKDLLLKAGRPCVSHYFIIKGCLRMYYINPKETEQVIQFAIENWWMTDYDSLEGRQASRYYIQALEDTQVVVLDRTVREELFIKIPILERYFRKILEKAFTAAQRRMEFFADMTDEQRYRQFSRRFPEFHQRVPQYMIASYLGVTPQFISRVRGRKG